MPALPRRTARLTALLTALAAALAVGPTGPGSADTASAPRGTLLIGDSMSWFARDEIHARRPGWAVNAARGREAEMLPVVLTRYVARHGVPRRLVIALGSNEDGASRELYRQVVDSLPDTATVVLVTTYRDPRVFGARATTMRRVSRWMGEIAAADRRTCVAPWREAVLADPGLVRDGVHATPRGERVWARLVTDTVAACGSAG